MPGLSLKTLSDLKWLLMVYRAPSATYAELDYLGPNGIFSETAQSQTAMSGFILEQVACSFGTYNCWFSGDGNASQEQYNVSIDIQVANLNYTGTCG